jgi:hypothetical protein
VSQTVLDPGRGQLQTAPSSASCIRPLVSARADRRAERVQRTAGSNGGLPATPFLLPAGTGSALDVHVQQVSVFASMISSAMPARSQPSWLHVGDEIAHGGC